MTDARDDDMVGPRVRVVARLAREDGNRDAAAGLGARCAAAITSPSPPVTTVQPRSASRRPISSAAASWAAPLPITDTCRRHRPMVCIAEMERRTARGGTLVLGGGFAGAYVARYLARRGATIVSPDNFMLYTPLLPEAASGTLEPRHVVVPLRRMCPHSELLLGTATALDEAARTVTAETLGGTFAIAYERLVVALGAITRVLPVPGSPSTVWGSRTSPTRLRCATACCASSSPRRHAWTRRNAVAISASCSSAPATQAWRRWRS